MPVVFASGSFKGALAAEVADINGRYNPQVKWNYAKDVFTNTDFKLKSQIELNIPSGKAILDK